MARFRPSRKAVAITAGVAAFGVVAMPAPAHADLLGGLLGNLPLCVDGGGLISGLLGGGSCSSGTLPVSIDQLKGPKGDTGATGAQGPKGDTGAQGLKGDKGDSGGPVGPAGAAGAAGAPGAAGKSGVSGYQIVSKPQTIKAGKAMTWTMSCGSTKKAIGGGVRSSKAGSFLTQGTGPAAGGNGWTVTVVNISKKSTKITGYAICASV